MHNPAYTGAYVYGRYRDNKTVNADGHFEHHPVRLPDKEEWRVFIPGHHQAYISWDDFEANQKQLCSNQTNTELCGPAREGAALLPGLLICGKCGRRMTVRYTGNGGIRPLYECVGRWEHGNKATCSSVPAVPLDQAVSDKILSIMKPSELEISLKVMHSINDTDRMPDKQWLPAVERAHYEADRAERQFMLADPENRLVVRSLEANWDQKLKDLEKAKQDYAAYRSKKPGSLPKKRKRTSWTLPAGSLSSGTHPLQHQWRRSALYVS
ncbi:recombinase family protein [Enterocloster clostridioformis]